MGIRVVYIMNKEISNLIKNDNYMYSLRNNLEFLLKCPILENI